MKKFLLFVLIATVLLSACKKEHNAPASTNDQEVYKVQFNLSGFNNQIIANDGSKQTTALRSYVTTNSSGNDTLNILHYLVYNSSGKFVHLVTKNSASGTFTGFSDNLPAGTYNLYFFAGKTGLMVDTAKAQIYYSAPNDSLGNWHDTFYKHVSITVTGNDSENIVLDRFVSALRINIQDAIPANAAKIVTTVKYEYQYYYILPRQAPPYTSPYVKTLTTLITADMVGKTNLQQYSIMSCSSAAASGGYSGYLQIVNISCYDAANNLLGSATVPLGTLQANRETILTGKIFNTGQTGNSFHVSLNDSWNPTPFQTITF